MEELFVEVAVPVALYDTFIYKIPSNLNQNDVVGRKVKVPFKSTKHYGIILDIKAPENFKYQIKNVFSVEEKVFTEKEIKILKKLSEFYISPIGLTVDYFVPDKIREKNIKDPFLGKVFYLKKDVELKNLTDKQLKLIDLFLESDYLSYEEIKEQGFDKKTLNSLIKKGYLEVKDGFPVLKDYSYVYQEIQTYDKPYNSLENKIYLFDEFYPEKRLNYYINLAKRLKGKGIHIILPSVELCNIYYTEFSKFFKDVYLYHDQLNVKEQWNVWKNAMEESGILIGTVSSILLPLKDLKILIVEEEDSKVYKVKRTPKFDVKRLAYFIHKEKKIPVILSSSIPSVEAFLSLKKKQVLPLTKENIVNIKNLKIMPHKNLNEDLYILKQIVLRDREVLIVSNKGYYSGMLFCERCGWQANCLKCGFHLSVHLENGKKYLQCGRCKAKYEYVSDCPDCGFKLSEEGFGKEKIEKFLKKSLPESYWNNFKVVSSLELKTLTVGKYQTVVNVYPDFLLEFPDFRSWEFFFRKITLPLTVCKENYIIFTNQEKEVMKFIENGKVKIKEFLEEELQRRKKMRLPPFIKTIKLEILTKKIKTNLIDEYVLSHFKSLKVIKKQLSENKVVYVFEYEKEEEKNLFKEFYIKISKNKNLKVSIEVNPANF